MLSEYRVTNCCHGKSASILGKTYGILHKKFYEISSTFY